MKRWTHVTMNLLMALLLCAALNPIARAVENTNGENVGDVTAAIQKLREKSDDAMQKADEKAQKAHEKQQQKLEKAQQKLERLQVELERKVKDSEERAEILAQIQSDLDLDLDLDIPNIHVAIPPVPPVSPPHLGHVADHFKGELVKDVVFKRFEASGDLPVQIESSFSSIVIEPTDANRISVEIVKQAGAKTREEAQKLIEKFDVTVEKKEAVLVGVQFKNQNEKMENSFMHCEIHIEAPASTTLRINNQFGDVEINKMKGASDVKNQFGGTRLSETAGDLNAFVQYGPLEIDNHDGALKAGAGFGEMKINVSGADPVNVTSSYGRADIFLHSAEAQLDGSFSFGDAHVVVPRNFSGRVEASSSFGEVNAIGFDSLQSKKEMFSQTLQGSVGQGAGSIKVKGSYGPVNIELADK